MYGQYTEVSPLLKFLREKEIKKQEEKEKKEREKENEEEREKERIKRCCLRKIAYSKKGAQTEINFLHDEGETNLRKYQCNVCNFWHLTHKPKLFDEEKKYKKRRSRM